MNLFRSLFFFFVCTLRKIDMIKLLFVEFSKCAHLNLKLVCDTCTDGNAVDPLSGVGTDRAVCRLPTTRFDEV